MAKHCFGVKHIVASCSSANVDFVKSLGATEVLDYRKCGPKGPAGWLEDWSKRNDKQFDVIIDNVGSDPSLYWQCHHYLKADQGKYVQVGGGLSLADITMLMKEMLWPTALGGGKRTYHFTGVENKREDFELINRWMAEDKIKCVIDDDDNRFDTVDAKKAYQKLDTGRVRGKIVIKMNDDA